LEHGPRVRLVIEVVDPFWPSAPPIDTPLSMDLDMSHQALLIRRVAPAVAEIRDGGRPPVPAVLVVVPFELHIDQPAVAVAAEQPGDALPAGPLLVAARVVMVNEQRSQDVPAAASRVYAATTGAPGADAF
jgi:hypothetical protein